MVKARTIYVWRGNDSVTITRGYEFTKGADGSLQTTVRHRGLFSGWVPVRIGEHQVSSPKKLCVGVGKFLDGWQVVDVYMDYNSMESYTPDINSRLVAQVKSLRNQIDMVTRLYHEERQKNIDRDGKDRLRKRMRDESKHFGEVRSSLYGGGGYDLFGGLSSKWDAPPGLPPGGDQ